MQPDLAQVRGLIQAMAREGHQDGAIIEELARRWPDLESAVAAELVASAPEPAPRRPVKAPAGPDPSSGDGDLEAEIRARLRRRQTRPRIIGDLLEKGSNWENVPLADLGAAYDRVKDEIEREKALPVAVAPQGNGVAADASIPPAAIAARAAEVLARATDPVVVNNALRWTRDRLSDPASGPKSSVFLSEYQKIPFYRDTKNGRSFFVKLDVAAAVFETVRSSAPEVRIGGAACVNGEFVADPGLHRAAAYYCTERAPVVPFDGSPVAAVAALYHEVFRFFPFVDQDHLVRVLAAVLSPFLQLQVDGPTPGFLMSAHNPGDGKTLLAKAISLLADGEKVVVPWGNGSKFEENILAELDSPARVVIVDNVKGELGGPTIEALLTSRRLRGNLKYEGSRVFSVDKMIVFTGNNVILSPDMARRVVRIQVDRGGAPEPEDMPDLETLIPRERGRFLGMIAAILTAWDGSMLPVQGHKSFEQWAATIGGILRDCGAMSEPLRLIDPDAVGADHDADVIKWGELLDNWFLRFGETAWGAAEIVAAVGTSTVKRAVGGFSGDAVRALGGALSGMNGRVLCGYRISRERERVHTALGENERNVYRLRKVLESVENNCTLSVASNRTPTCARGVLPDALTCSYGFDATDNNQINEGVKRPPPWVEDLIPESDLGGYPPGAFEEE